MSSKAGDYTPDELELLVNKLQVQVQTTRRENLVRLIAAIDDLAQTISKELKIDQALLDRKKARYKEEFSLFDRINPFNTERHEAHQRNVQPMDNEVRQDQVLLTRCCELLSFSAMTNVVKASKKTPKSRFRLSPYLPPIQKGRIGTSRGISLILAKISACCVFRVVGQPTYGSRFI